MESRSEFREQIQTILNDIEPEALAYDESEFWMIRSAYEYVDFYAVTHQLTNTCIALPLVRGLHNGVHRKSSITKDGVSYRLPYMIHPLQVCRFLIDLQIPISHEEEDILLASALCHDLIEDIPFLDHGREMIYMYHLDEQVYETVREVSKRRDFTDREELDFFHQIEEHKLALLVKLSDRGNNVEDLYNMSLWKIHEYARETRKYFLPMCQYARDHYPELLMTIQMMENKMLSLIEAAEVLADTYHIKEEALLHDLESLKKENQQLRSTWQELWNS